MYEFSERKYVLRGCLKRPLSDLKFLLCQKADFRALSVLMKDCQSF